MTDRLGARFRITQRRRPGAYGYGGGFYGPTNWWGDRDPDDPGDLTTTRNLGEQFDGYGDGGGDGGGGDGGGGGGE